MEGGEEKEGENTHIFTFFFFDEPSEDLYRLPRK